MSNLTCRWRRKFGEWCKSHDIFAEDSNSFPADKQVRQLQEKAGM